MAEINREIHNKIHKQANNDLYNGSNTCACSKVDNKAHNNTCSNVQTLQQRRRTRALRIIRRWRLLDDEFMKRCLKDNLEAVQCILRIIMENNSLVVTAVKIEDTIPSLSGHGVRLDVRATDAGGRKYNIEVQRSDKGADRKRARFNSSLLDLDSLPKGAGYEQLPETYVIFITENDVLKHGQARYHIERMICEANELFNDGEHIIYVNGAYEGDDDIGKLMNDFRSSSPDTMLLEPLREVVNRYKNNPEEVADMCREMELWSDEERREGRAEGRREGRAEGIVEGRAAGEGLLASLMKLLRADRRDSDIDLALSDTEARQRLYLEYHLI